MFYLQEKFLKKTCQKVLNKVLGKNVIRKFSDIKSYKELLLERINFGKKKS